MENYPNGNSSYTEFLLTGFSGLKGQRHFLFIPFFIMFVLALAANSVLIFVIITTRSLHAPMYILISAIACVDLSWPIVIAPKMLFSLLFNWNGITLLGCLTQMFFVNFIGALQSSILMGMALDRYVAILYPLHYNDYVNVATFVKLYAVVIFRNLILNIAVVTLAGSHTFCSNVIDHCFCEHMALVKLACGSTTKNSIVGLVASSCITSVDCLCILISYGKIFNSVFRTSSVKSCQKAIHTCVTHFIVIGISYVCAMTAFLTYRTENTMSSNSRVLISVMYILVPGSFNPIVYGIRTKEIREQIIKIVQCRKIVPV
ncbi:olfactory receptor 52L1-like [Amia ocellicauda]|uniref:olfactory receptor 52L1-like n=1 Tax=Amia ocellicauda TaxID=2972642 RepID=UPI0034643EA2